MDFPHLYNKFSFFCIGPFSIKRFIGNIENKNLLKALAIKNTLLLSVAILRFVVFPFVTLIVRYIMR